MRMLLKSRLCLLAFTFCLSSLALSASAQQTQAPMKSEAVAQAAKPASSTTQMPPPSSGSLTSPESSHASPQEQIEADTKKLYELAQELRTEVGKTYKQSLSVDVLKKAGELERLAKSLKSEMDHQASAKKR
jgi:hypothetical protein